jgi:pimeloyl-ACP methyl ester carboxylesterase
LATITKLPGSVWLITQSLRPRPAQRLPIAFGWVTKRLPDKAVVDKWLGPVRTSRGVRRDVGKLFRAIDARYTLEAAEKLKGFEKPVLLAWATEDKLFPVEYAHRLASELPNATVHEIPDAYTFIAEDQPDRLAEVIAGFVRRPAAVSA